MIKRVPKRLRYDIREPEPTSTTSSWRATRRAAAPRPSRSRRSCRRPTAFCRHAHASCTPLRRSSPSPHVLVPHARERAAHAPRGASGRCAMPLRKEGMVAGSTRASRSATSSGSRLQSARARARARAAQRAAPRGARRCPRSRSSDASSGSHSRLACAQASVSPVSRPSRSSTPPSTRSSDRPSAATSPRCPPPASLSGWPKSSVLSGGIPRSRRVRRSWAWTRCTPRTCGRPTAAREPLSDDPAHARLRALQIRADLRVRRQFEPMALRASVTGALVRAGPTSRSRASTCCTPSRTRASRTG